MTTESSRSNYLKIVFGFTVFALGLGFASVEMYQGMVLNQNEDIWLFVRHMSMCLVFMLIGGYIMAPAATEQIADNIIDKLGPLLNRLPGGRRKTDPPSGTPPDPNGG